MDLGQIIRAMLTNKPRFGLIAMQIATTLAIVVNCVVLVVDARRKLGVSSGLDDKHLLRVHIVSPLPNSRPAEERYAWDQRTLDDLRRMSGIESSSASTFKPWSCHHGDMAKAANMHTEKLLIGACTADEILPETIGLKMDEGRWFSHDEVQKGTKNIIITRVLGRRLFGDGPLVGKSLEDFFGNLEPIIGVVQDPQSADQTWYDHVHHKDVRCGLFRAGIRPRNFVVRVEPGKTDEVVMRINQYLEGRNASGQSVVESFAVLRDRQFGQQRTIVAIMGSLAVLILFIASLALAGITSFSVTERTRQIGIRRALGATTTDILRYFLTECAVVTALGLVIGSGLAVLLNMAVLRIYDSARLSAPIVYGCALLLGFVALGAALPPALRASKVSPAIATKNV